MSQPLGDSAFNWVPWVYLVWPELDESTCSLPVFWHIHRIMPGLAHQYLHICFKICHVIKISTLLYTQGLKELSKVRFSASLTSKVTHSTWTLLASYLEFIQIKYFRWKIEPWFFHATFLLKEEISYSYFSTGCHK